MATEPQGVYPLSSPDKQAIPFDVGEVSGLIIQSFTDAASVELELPTEDCLLVLYASALAIVSFGEFAPSRTEGDFLEGLVFLPEKVAVTVKPKVATFKVMSATVGTSGILYGQVWTRWQSITPDALRSQY